MKIREEQIKAFEDASIDQYVTRSIAFLRDAFPDAHEVPDDELRPEIARQINKAKTYGLQTEQEVACYITTAWVLGTEFDEEFPVAQEKLSDMQFEPQQKAQWLEEWTISIFDALAGDEE